MNAPVALDLPARILAEIEKAEHRLQCIDGSALRMLRTDAQHAALIARAFGNLPSDTVVDEDDVDSILTQVLPEADRQVVDVELGLRRCAADRRIIGRHKADTRYVWDPVLDDDREVEYCKPCTMGNGCSCCISDADNDYEPWPCATLRDLAEGYGITVSETP